MSLRDAAAAALDAWDKSDALALHVWFVSNDDFAVMNNLRSALAEPERKLTDDEIWALWKFPDDLSWRESVIALVRAVEKCK